MPHSVPSEGSDPQKDPTHPEGGWQAIRKWFEKNRFQVLFFLGGLALYLLLGIFLWWLLQLYVDPSAIKDPSKEATAKKDLLQALAFIMAGVAGAIGIYFTWRGQRLTQEGTQEELRITREGQITERFTRAIDQLGKVDNKGEKLFEIRVGGIYALERIARESEEDYWPIMEVLTAYVRQHAHEPRPWWEQGGPEGREEAAVERIWRGAPDIQAIMTIIRRRPRSFNYGEPEGLDLHETNLWRVNLRGANLEGALLVLANLEGAVLLGATFSGAHLFGANLGGALLEGADLTQADLTQADLTQANLEGAHLFGANLGGAHLFGADLSGAQDLTQEQLEQAEGDENTQLPSNLKCPSTWDVKTYEHGEGD
jgi:hypothetical protein